MKEISVVIPVYRAEKILNELCSRLINNLSLITEDFEIILIDDGSPDKSWNEICSLAKDEPRIHGYKLSRNFGQHHAITAGIDLCNAAWTIVMDCDLQDSPEDIYRLYQKAQNSYDIVLVARKNRKDTFIKRITSKFFYSFLSLLSGIKYNGEIGNYGIYNKNVIDSVKTFREPQRFFVSTIQWIGFSKSILEVEHNNRYEGKSTYSYKKLTKLALNIVISHSNKPLKILIYFGFTLSLSSVLFVIYTLYLKFSGHITEPGYTSIISSIWFLSGAIISSLGILGLYLGKVYDGIKNRPLYIISEKTTNE